MLYNYTTPIVSKRLVVYKIINFFQAIKVDIYSKRGINIILWGNENFLIVILNRKVISTNMEHASTQNISWNNIRDNNIYNT